MASGPIETKVNVAGVASTVTTAIMGYVMLKWGLPGSVGAPVEALVYAAVVGALTWFSAYWAKHTNRTDNDATEGRHA